jgi:SHS family lactate transporter-like MFS transporter
MAWWLEVTRTQWRTLIAVSAGWVLDAFDFTILLLVMPEIAKEFGVTLTSTAWTITLTLLTRLAGGVVSGWMADRFGRRLPLMLSIAWFAVCDGAVALAPSFAWIVALRTLFGFGMGAEWTAGSALVMESWPARSRGVASGILQGSWAVGYVLAALGNQFIVARYGWRPLFALAAAPVLLVIPIRLLVHESHAPRSVTWAGLLTREVVVRVVWATLLLGAAFGAYYGISAAYASLLKVYFECPPSRVSLLLTLFNLGMLVGAVAWGALAARRGVVVAMLVPSLGLACTVALHVGIVPSLLWLGALCGGVFGAGLSGVTPVMLTALFPAEVRARGIGIVYHAAAALAAFVPPLVTSLHDSGRLPLGASMAFVAIGCVLIICVTMLARPRSVREVLG